MKGIIRFSLDFKWSQLLGLALFVLSACVPIQETKTEKVCLVDSEKATACINTDSVRIIPLSPALTEMLFAIGADQKIIALDHVSNYPSSKVANYQRVNTYPLAFEKLLTLKPNLLVTEQGMTQPADIARLRELGFPVYSFKYESVEDVFNAIDTLGKMTNLQKSAKVVSDSLKERLNNLTKPIIKDRVSVIALVWTDPIIVYGNKSLMVEKIKLAGGKLLAPLNSPNPFPEVSREYLLQSDPDCILGLSKGKFDSTLCTRFPELRQLKAFKNGNIFTLNDDLATRPSPRIVQSIEEIAAALAKVKNK